MKVLISAPYMIPVIDRFRSRFDKRGIELVIADVGERLEEADLLDIITDIDGVICGDDRFTPRVIEKANRLKVISKWGTGIDSIDQEACAVKGIVIGNTPNAFSEPVADSVMGYILAFARNIPWMDQQMKNGGWHKIPGHALRECTLGIIGVGNVGKAVVRRANAFGIRLLGHDPITPDDNFLNQYNMEMVSKARILVEADYLSLNCDLNPTSHHLLDAEAFGQMKPTAVVINAARGPVIHEEALINALQTGQIAGAALDVFEFEPLPLDSPLRQMDQVLLAPHNSNSSPEAWEKVHENTIDNLLNAL